MKTRLSSILGAIAILSLITAVPMAHAAGKGISPSDRMFLNDAARYSAVETQMGQLASTKATTPEVKQFADQAAKENSKQSQDLAQLSQKEGIKLPKGMDRAEQHMVKTLSSLNGNQFDRTYLEYAAREYRYDLDHASREADHGKSPAVRSFAANRVPTLEARLQTAQRLYEHPQAANANQNRMASNQGMTNQSTAGATHNQAKANTGQTTGTTSGQAASGTNQNQTAGHANGQS